MANTSNISKADLQHLDRFADSQSETSTYDEMLKQPIPRAERIGIYFMTLLLLGTLTVLYFGKVNIIVLTRGVVQPAGVISQIEAQEGGLVIQVLARPGDRLEEGDPIIKLDFSQKGLELTQRQNDLNMLEQQLKKQQTTKAVVEAMMQDMKTFLESDERRQLSGDMLTHFMYLKKTWSQLDNVRGLFRKAFEDKQTQTQHEIRLEKNRLEAMIKNRSAKQIYEDQQKVFADIDLAISNQQIRLNELNINLQEAQHQYQQQIEEAELAYNQAATEFHEGYSQLLENIQKLKNQITIQKGKLLLDKDRLEKAVIRMPFSGYIAEMNVNNTGQLISVGALVAVAIPSDSLMEVAVEVPNKDIGFINVNTFASVKVDAFPYKDFGTIPAEVERIVPNVGGDKAFSVVLKLKKQHIQKAGQTYALFPGLTVEADIITRKIRLYQLIFKPR